jgi:8-oxo-dGTP pyrophosphatase MutT (NUDIX family)
MHPCWKQILNQSPAELPLPEGFKDAAVIVPVWEGKLLFTVRSAHLPHHAAQISFPGGRLDVGETPKQAALREAWEEVGLEASNLNLLGQLNPTLSPFGYRVFVFVGEILSEPVLTPDPQEVGEVLWIPLADLLSAAAYSEERAPLPLIAKARGSNFKSIIWHYPWRGHDIWGMTGNIVHDLLGRIRGAGLIDLSGENPLH